MFCYLFAGIGEPLIGWLIEKHQITTSDGGSVDNTGLVFLVVTVACLASATMGLFIRR